ncbi:uncharacterized protein LOC109594552 [Aethina tumida]|uniref:uncharacterized protein LOC109594552 n=1 Tax=Aethina tumida TaxID=116153 RepID=UPI0021485CA0|nr:uncharacterized protein LOC109594552 [Aethina tumida]
MNYDQIKLESVLNSVYNNKFSVNNDLRQLLLDFVKEEASNGNHKFTKNTSIFSNWIESIVKSWISITPSTNSMIFFIDIITEFSLNEINFLLLHQDEIIIKTVDMLKQMNVTKDADLMRAYLKMLNSFIFNEYSNHWLASSFNLWCNVFDTIKTELVTKELAEFTANFRAYVIQQNKLLLIDFSNIILKPFIELNAKINSGNLNGTNENELYNELMPTIKLLNESFQHILLQKENKTYWNGTGSTLIPFNKLLNNLLLVVNNKEHILQLSKLLLYMKIFDLKNYKYHTEFVTSFKNKMEEILILNINKKCTNNVLNILYHCMLLWHNINKIIELSSLQMDYRLDLILIAISNTPTYVVMFQVIGRNLAAMWLEDDIREMISDNVLKAMDKETIDLFYKFRNLVMEEMFLTQLATESIQLCLNARHFCTRIAITYLFQMLVYILEDIAPDIFKNNGFKSPFYDESYIRDSLDGLTILIEEFDLSWKDGVETIKVLKIVTEYLSKLILSPEIISKCLNLAKLCINKQMCPNLILLVDSEDSPLNSLGPLVNTHILSENNEISRRALELLLAISEKAVSEYPHFRSVIQNSNLHEKILDLSTSCDASELKLIALKCLKYLVKINAVWRTMSSQKILDQFIDNLKNEKVKNLRAELVYLIVSIYDEDYFTEEQMNEIYNIMSHLGVYDYEMKVRINILHFWEKVIDKLLCEQGMIDNEFPEVTFSKDTRKIIILDDGEILKRLRKIMYELSDIGCLFVLSRISISRKKEEKYICWSVINRLLEILKKYNVEIGNIEQEKSQYTEKKLCGMHTDLYPDTEIVTVRHFLANVMDCNSEDVIKEQKVVHTLDELLDKIILKHEDIIG